MGGSENITDHNIDYNDDDSPNQYKMQDPLTTGLDDVLSEICATEQNSGTRMDKRAMMIGDILSFGAMQ